LDFSDNNISDIKILEKVKFKNLEDNASPIFDQNNNEIGYAWLYNPKISDYSKYMFNYELEAIINL